MQCALWAAEIITSPFRVPSFAIAVGIGSSVFIPGGAGIGGIGLRSAPEQAAGIRSAASAEPERTVAATKLSPTRNLRVRRADGGERAVVIMVTSR